MAPIPDVMYDILRLQNNKHKIKHNKIWDQHQQTLLCHIYGHPPPAIDFLLGFQRFQIAKEIVHVENFQWI